MRVRRKILQRDRKTRSEAKKRKKKRRSGFFFTLLRVFSGCEELSDFSRDERLGGKKKNSSPLLRLHSVKRNT